MSAEEIQKKPQNLYNHKQNSYFSNIRHDLISLIPKNFKADKVLEIGCGSGETLNYLQSNGIANNVTGIDIVKIRESHQSNLDRFIAGNIENINLDFSKNSFDLILCGDVLEHLINPWEALKRLKPFLKDDGYLIASIPNIRFYKVLYKVFISGDFKYENEGILDKTHLRFFCYKNIIDLFNSSGYKIDKIVSDFDVVKCKRTYANKVLFHLFRNFFTIQYLTVAQKENSDVSC